jgi:hypothetical protein
VRVGGLADGTVAADGGDSHGGTGTEDGEMEGGQGHGTILRRGRGWGKGSCQFSVVSFQFKRSERKKMTRPSQVWARRSRKEGYQRSEIRKREERLARAVES